MAERIISSPTINQAQAVNTVPVRPQTNAGQVIPAASAFEMAEAELSSMSDFPGLALNGALGVTAESLIGTIEDMGFALGARAGARSLGAMTRDQSTERTRQRSMLQRVSGLATDQVDELLARVPEIDDSSDPYDEMRRRGFDIGEMALLLGARLANKALAPEARQRLERALATVMSDDKWVLQLFSRLEFGATGRRDFAELRALYQRAAALRPQLAQWFGQFRGLKDRKRKLKTLIRALAFELSAEGPATDLRLAGVIGDLKRILQFLGMEDHCEQLAQSLTHEQIEGDDVLGVVIEIVQQPWLHAEAIEQHARTLVQSAESRYPLASRLKEIFKLLPADCFEDEMQRGAILDAFGEYLEKLADEEE
jgi:type III secretion system YopN/LcrE/InvE/MxiC family regulator